MPDQALLLPVEGDVLVEVVQDALREGGYHVRREATAEGAIVALEGDEPVLDPGYRHPIGGAGQWQMAHHARTPNADVAAIYMSGDCGHAHQAEGGPDSIFLQKPFALKVERRRRGRRSSQGAFGAAPWNPDER